MHKRALLARFCSNWWAAWPVLRGLRSWRGSLLNENVKAMLGVCSGALCSVCVLVGRWRCASSAADNLETWAMLGVTRRALWRWLWPLRCNDRFAALVLLLIRCKVFSAVLALLCSEGCARSFRSCSAFSFVRGGLLRRALGKRNLLG